jgi:RecA/RadA recombinase
MAGNKWMGKLARLDGAIAERRNVHSTVVSTPSPSVNMVFGGAHGLPLGYTLVMYGPPKGGKSLLASAMIGNLHQNYEDAIALRYDTEFRDLGQMNDKTMKMFGIDPDRYMSFSINTPDGIFDAIEHKVAAMCEEGAPIKLIVIDSINGIMGRRALNNESVLSQTIGDTALTLGDGFKRILPVQRKYGIAVVLVSQARSEMDQAEIMRGNKIRMASAFQVQHYAEYFMLVEPNKTKSGRTSLDGKEFVDDTVGDMSDRGDRYAHKIRVCMKDSSMGNKGRVGEFTFDYNKGFINVHEEVFTLGVNRGIISKPNQLTYSFNGRSWKGQAAMVEALKNEPELQVAVVKELKRRDMEGGLPVTAEEVAASQEESA